jgi:replicative DNA helicase
MIELQVLNYVLEKKSFALLKQNGITLDYFVTYAGEAEFLYNHYEKYNTVPDKETFVSQFADFDLFIVSESEQYMVETFKEQHLYNQMVPFVNNINNLVAEDSDKAIKYAQAELSKLAGINVKIVPGYDIVKNAPERGEEYKTRLEAEGLIGVTTGIQEFDEITHGWFPGEELVVIVGRTNEGKTWVLLFFLVAAWKAGKRVLLYSGEMPKDIIGFRVDTLSEHFSHSALTTGSPDLGEGAKPEDYYAYLNSISKDPKLPPFIVVTPKDFGGRKPTVDDIRSIAEQYKPDIIGVDQLSLMEDGRSGHGQQERIRYTHVSEDLYLLSEELGVPILSPSQATRSSVKKGEDDEETPDLHEISESDGIGQNATRVIGMKQIGTTLKLSVRKSRYSKKGSEVLLLWDIDRGLIKPFMAVSKDSNNNVTSTKPTQNAMSGQDLF